MCFISFSQEKKTYSLAELDITIPRENGVVYNYTTGQVFLKEYVMYGISYSYNYNVSKRFTLGALGGVTHLGNPLTTALKMGAVFRFTFIPDYQANGYVQLLGYVPFNSGRTIGLGEARMGINIPIARFEKSVMTLGFYTAVARFDISKPLFGDEKDTFVRHRGSGISIGLKF